MILLSYNLTSGQWVELGFFNWRKCVILTVSENNGLLYTSIFSCTHFTCHMFFSSSKVKVDKWISALVMSLKEEVMWGPGVTYGLVDICTTSRRCVDNVTMIVWTCFKYYPKLTFSLLLYVYLRIRSASPPLKRKFRQLSQCFVICSQKMGL